MAETSSEPSATRPTIVVSIAWIVGAVVVACLADLVFASIAHAAGSPHKFSPLKPVSFVPLTVFGIVIGAIGWALIRRYAARPRAVLKIVVPLVVALSWLPDIMLYINKTKAGTTERGVATLMVMHLTVAAIAVFAFLKAMPLPADRARD